MLCGACTSKSCHIVFRSLVSRTEIDENVRKSVNLLLTKSMSGRHTTAYTLQCTALSLSLVHTGCLATLLEKGNLTIHQVCRF